MTAVSLHINTSREAPSRKEAKVLGIPRHVLIIPDNNRTWAKSQVPPLTLLAGYRLGAQRLVEVAQEASAIDGLDFLTINLVSADNINGRPQHELNDIWQAVQENMLSEGLPELVANGARIRVIGNPDDQRIPQHIRHGFAELCERSEENTGLGITIALGYDMDQEQRDADVTAKAVSKWLTNSRTRDDYEDPKQYPDPEKWDFRKNFLHLPAAGLPNVNLVIRTGEIRTSGILPYGIAHSQLEFVRSRTWPEFTAEEFRGIIAVRAGDPIKGGK